MTTNPAENVAAVAGAAVEGIVAEAAAAVEAANERAEAAREVGVLLTEAAIQRDISERVDDVEEGLETCENQNAALQAEITSLREMVTALQASLTTFLTMEMLTAELAKLSSQSTRQAPHQAETQTEAETVSPNAAGADGHPEAGPKEKPSRYHLT